jgi:ethanolamine ammonia-lyase small subunit
MRIHNLSSLSTYMTYNKVVPLVEITGTCISKMSAYLAVILKSHPGLDVTEEIANSVISMILFHM